jgi:hypothetical protein
MNGLTETSRPGRPLASDHQYGDAGQDSRNVSGLWRRRVPMFPEGGDPFGMLYVGMDLAETHPHQVCLMRDETLVAERRAPNTADGLRRLVQTITAEEPDADAVLVAVERPDSPCVDGLVGAGYTVYAINPKAIERYRDRVALGGTKTARLDARCLASILRTDRANRPLAPENARTRELRLVTRDLAELEKTHTMLAHQLRAALVAASPAAVAVFRDLTAPSTLGFLQTYPTRDAARAASDEEVAAVLKRHGYSNPGRKLPALREALAQEPEVEICPQPLRVASQARRAPPPRIPGPAPGPTGGRTGPRRAASGGRPGSGRPPWPSSSGSSPTTTSPTKRSA